MKDKKGQLEIFSNPKVLIYIIGGATIGYLFGQDLISAVIGGIAGFVISFIK